MSQANNLSKGKILPVIIRFYIPLLCTNLLQQIYTIADTAIVGKGLGDNMLAAVGNMASLIFLVFGFASGLSNGFAVIVGMKFGAKDEKQLKRSIAATIQLYFLIAVTLTIISTLALKWLLTMLQTDNSIMDASLLYGHIIFGGIAATLAYNMGAAVLRALGDSKTPLYAIIISSVVNIVLDIVFIFLLRTGVEGAAIATIFAQLVSAAICFRKLTRIQIIRPSRDDFKTAFSIYGPMLKNGLPMAIMNSITAVGLVVVQSFVNALGVAYTSAYSVCSRVLNMFEQPGCTAGYAMSAFTSQNYGAGEYRRIKDGLKVLAMVGIVSYIILGALEVFIPGQLASLMISGEQPIKYVTQFLPITGIGLISLNILFVFRSGTQGMGYPTLPMISGIAEMIARITVIVIFMPIISFRAAAIAEVTSWTIAMIINVCAFTYHLRQSLKGNVAITDM